MCGVGINDSNYITTKYETINGKRKRVWVCPYYARWKTIIERCYSNNNPRNVTYNKCIVCDEWLTFSNFREWMISLDWVGKHIDKDILKFDNNVYCPAYCVFVDPLVNTIITDNLSQPNGYMLGVAYNTKTGRYESRCRNPFSKKQERLGSYDTELEAHEVWRKKKIQHIRQIKDRMPSIVFQSLLNRYKKGSEYDILSIQPN